MAGVGSYGGGNIDSWTQQIAGSHEARQRNPQPAPPVRQPDPATTSGHFQQPSPQQPQQQDDPWARARAGIEATYLNSTGRQAAAGDADKWLSGQFGHGSGLGDYDKFITAIMSSPEARAYRPAAPTNNNGYQNLEYWQSQGVPAIDMFDPMTGQLKQGWQRTARGYERTGGATGGASNVAGPQNGDFQSWFMGLTQGKAPSPQSLEAMGPMLAQYGIRLGPRNARGFTDGIILPNGQFIDVITSATETGGTGWAWQTGAGGHNGSSGGSGGPGGGGIGGVQLPGSQFNDPHTKMLEELMLARINSLQSGDDAGLQRLMSFLEQRFSDLQGPGRTGAEEEVLRTQALDPIERDRQAARQRLTERLAARGITQESGIFQQALAQLDHEFDGMRAQTQTSMASNEIQRREGSQQMAVNVAMSMYDIPQGRAREALGYAGSLADLGPQRLQLAMQAAGMGGSPQSMFSSLMQMAQLNQNSQLLDQRNSGQLWQGLGSIAAILANSGR
jgi:hypothetical protein